MAATSFFGGEFFGGEFFNVSGTPPPPPIVASTPSGVKRRWALKKDKKLYYFDSLQQMRAYQEIDQGEVVVPPQTERQAKKLGYKTIKLEASKGNYDFLSKIEAEIEQSLASERMLLAQLRDEEDFADFMEFIETV